MTGFLGYLLYTKVLVHMMGVQLVPFVSDETHNALVTVFSNFVAAFLFVLFPGQVAPSLKRGVCSLAGVAICLLALGSWLTALGSETADAWYTTRMIFTALGSAGGMIAIFRLEAMDQEPDHPDQ